MADLVFVGLPETGKTTYLALLYRAIAAQKAGAFRLGSYKDDREYVNQIAGRLADCRPADRTAAGENQKLSLSVSYGESDLALTIPDVSGETWRDALLTRSWTEELDEQVAKASAFAIFVNAGQIDTQPTIAETQAGLAAVGVDGPVDLDIADSEAEDRTRATQIDLVDLLQLLASRHNPPMHVGLLISAWDLITESTTPHHWLAENLPLLHQYLETNRSWLDATVWSISAQGGDFSTETVRQRLLPQDVVERSATQAADGTTTGVESPLAWLLGS